MSSFWADSLRYFTTVGNEQPLLVPQGTSTLVEFLGLVFSGPAGIDIGMQPILTNAHPTFSDTSMGGITFDVRRVKASSLPHGLVDQVLKEREYVVVKHMKPNGEGNVGADPFEEMATELQILRDAGIRSHANIIDFLGLLYHNSGTSKMPIISPAIAVEYAQWGSLKDFQADGYGRTIIDRYDICRDIAVGLEYLHSRGIMHGDIKDTNILVCKHSNRQIIVKLSDFGFALSLHHDNPRLKGYTKFLDAPEAQRPLEKGYLMQLDVYSYGLLMYTVLKYGAAFYEVAPEDDRLENVNKLKASNLLPSLMQTNLLLNLQGDRCLMLIFCKIIAYSLRADPKERFQDMNHILEHLKWADPRDLDPACQTSNDLYSTRRFQTSFYPDSKQMVLAAFDAQLEQYYHQIKDNVPLSDMLWKLYKQRKEIEVEMIMSKPQPTDTTHYSWCGGLNLACWRFPFEVFVYPPVLAAGQEPFRNIFITGPEQIKLSRPQLVDLSLHDHVMKKVAEPVKLFIVGELGDLASNKDSARAAQAKYNLGYCYIDGIGVDADVEKGLKLVEEAAMAGSSIAQQRMLQVYAAKDSAMNASRMHNLIAWSEYIWSVPCKQAVQCLRKADPDLASQLLDRWCLQRSRELESTMSFEFDHTHNTPDPVRRLHTAAAMGHLDIVEQTLQEEKSMIDSRNDYGQSALMVACQCSRFSVVEYLLDHNAAVDLADKDGFTALHWLINFDDSEKQAIHTKLRSRVPDCNKWGVWPVSSDKQPNLKGGFRCSGSPLHWATMCSDLAMVDILLDLGGNATFGPDSYARTAFDAACGMHESKIVKRMLQEASVKAVVPSYRQFDQSSDIVQVNALFWVLGGGAAFARVLRHGEAYRQETKQTMEALMEAGVSCEAVLVTGRLRLSAVFATAWHHCNADIMQSGLQLGFFQPYIDSTFGNESSGGPAMSLALAHRDRTMFKYLLDAGASVSWKNKYEQTSLTLASKEVDDPWYIEQLLLNNRMRVEDDTGPATAFCTAVYCGNLRVAKYLWDRGARRDRRVKDSGLTILGQLIGMRTQNAADRIRFILSLPDRDEGDGFIVLHEPVTGHESSAFHLAVSPQSPFDENPASEETCRLTISLLLQKYSDPKYINSTIGPHHGVPLGLAVEIGNHHAALMFLEKGADPNAKDEYGRTPLDLLYWRYYYPSTLGVLKEVRHKDRQTIGKVLRYVNSNTSNCLNFLKDYDAKTNVFREPVWAQALPGLRGLDWVIQRLKEDEGRPPVDGTRPNWGGLPITIPERPMQLEEKRRQREHAEQQAQGEQQDCIGSQPQD